MERRGTLKMTRCYSGKSGKSGKTRYPENDKVLQDGGWKDKAHSHSLALTQAHLCSSVEKLREIRG